ncbi:MAG: isoprenylcysteine carboxylmethyltransferase family protein [Bacteroidales bacterium]|nr:isoprenylcysteine carboxylmethyltransferase family protein [Bacteroidales bacterium]
METIRSILGYLLGLLVFVCGVPALMWWVSGRECPYLPASGAQWIVAVVLAVAGLSLSVYSIVYMKKVGKGNPFDACNNEIAPRTKHLMTGGPYRFSRNPMLSGIYLYDIGVLVFLLSWPAALVFVAEVALLTIQVGFEEKRLEADFGQEYLDYKHHIGKYITLRKTRKTQ